MFATFGFLLAYWKWIILGLGLSVGLGYFAFMMRNWRAVVVAGAIVAMLVGVGIVDRRGYQRHAAEVAAMQDKIIKARERTIAEAEAESARRAEEDAKRIAELEREIEQTPKNDNACHDEEAARRIGDIK